MSVLTRLSDRFSNKLRYGSFLGWRLLQVRRRLSWLRDNAAPGTLWNSAMAAQAFVRKAEHVPAMPVVVKVDISPLCNLHCTVCVHAHPGGNSDLEAQRFDPKHKMSVQQFTRIIEELRGKTSTVSLYYLGDPLMHPDLDRMCRIARDAGLNVHASSNFSFKLSDERLLSIVRSGMTHFTVCVDGLSQENYSRTRVGGNIERVLDNLERLCRTRTELRSRYPRIEVQYIKFQHNVAELPEAERRLKAIGVDHVESFWGQLHNYTDIDPANVRVIGPRKNAARPRCGWPHLSTVIKYNGDVIPCCYYRTGLQYTDHDDKRTLGNVFETSLREIWNSPQYGAIRRLVSNPERILTEPELAGSFCDGCGELFDTDRATKYRSAERYRFEDLYAMDERERPRRVRPGPVLQGV